MNENASRTKKTVVNTAFSFASQILQIILSFALRTAFIKILGDQYTGVASVFTTILSMLSLSELGFGTAVATALYRPLREKDNKTIQQLMDFYKKAYRIVAGFIFLVGMCLVPFLGYLIKDVPDIKESISVIYVFYIIKTATSYLMIYKTTLLRADQKLYIVKKFEMAAQTVRYLVEIIVLIVFKQYMTYLVLEVAATIAQNYVVTKRAEREYPLAFEKPEVKLPKERVISLLKDVKGLSMFKLSGHIGNSIDTMLISGFINTSTVTLVGNYTLIKNNINKVLVQFYSAVIPSIGNLAAERKPKKQEKVFDRLFYVSFLMVNFCSASLFVIIKPFMRIWLGERYILSQPISFVIAFDFFLYILLQAVASFRTANGLFVEGQYRPLFTAIINVVLSVLLIKKLGIFGTILATIIARLVTQWYDPYLLYKYIFKSGFPRFYAKYWMYIVMFVSGLFVSDRLTAVLSRGGPVFDLAVAVCVSAVVPTAWVLLLTCRSDNFKYVCGMAGRLLKRRRGRKENG